jgi:hypothetical protein
MDFLFQVALVIMWFQSDEHLLCSWDHATGTEDSKTFQASFNFSRAYKKFQESIWWINEECDTTWKAHKDKGTFLTKPFCYLLVLNHLLYLLTKLISQATQISTFTKFRVLANNEISERRTENSLMSDFFGMVTHKTTLDLTFKELKTSILISWQKAR